MTGKTSDHLANERTYLAWVRTALGLIGLGFVLARMGLFLRQLTVAAPALAGPAARGLNDGHEFLVSGVVFLAIGVAFCGWAAWSYARNYRSIESDHFEPARLSVVALSGVVVVGGLGLVALVLWRTLDP